LKDPFQKFQKREEEEIARPISVTQILSTRFMLKPATTCIRITNLNTSSQAIVCNSGSAVGNQAPAIERCSGTF
jgi:hypothetical protein